MEKIIEEPSNDTEEIIESEEENIERDPEELMEIKEEVPKKSIKRAKPVKKIKSECGADIELRYRSAKPAKSIPIVVYYDDIVEEPEPAKVIVKRKATRGRPKKKPVIQYINDEGDVVSDKMEAVQTIINAPEKENYTEKDIKLIELEKKIMELEAVSGKKIRATKKGKVDQRQAKAPSEKQLEARKRFVEANKARHAKKKADKLNTDKLETKENVKEVIAELSAIKQSAIQKKNADDTLRNQILEEERQRVEAEKKNNKFGRWDGDDLFK